MFARPGNAAEAEPVESAPVRTAETAPAKRPPSWSPSNWPVRWKVLAIVLVPLILATVFGGLRVNSALANSSGLRLAAARADVLPAITKYMSALDVALLASSTNRDVEGAKKNFEARKGELQARLADTDVIPEFSHAAHKALLRTWAVGGIVSWLGTWTQWPSALNSRP